MHVNADLSERADVTPDTYCWVTSPQPGVERVMLERDGGEQARATSIVRYASGSWFPRHSHPLGEEILVLNGKFSDEQHTYSAGWYLRNPPGSSHRPWSNEGALLFVKLRQMRSEQQQEIRVNTSDECNWTLYQGRVVCPLFRDALESVRLEWVPPSSNAIFDNSGGVEVLVVDGGLQSDECCYPKGSWLRFPPSGQSALRAGSRGATIYVKMGHLVSAKRSI
ncbi:cupin domain-containing protein [Paraburkholderia caribensis]|uniref:cupin domain-containing protein n=1 Tax=Paraburkholderia caribensis TaxID=75105 RepID=UPI001CB6275A|nr:cupin domain-containing protein [Paraburkholderia caribensis]CAG9249608.1 conserved hypothetical protein [Paraburkholderia caribensis]